MNDSGSARRENAPVAPLGDWTRAVIPLVLVGELVTVHVFVSLLPPPRSVPSEPLAAAAAPVAAAKPAAAPAARKRRKDIAEPKPGAAESVKPVSPDPAASDATLADTPAAGETREAAPAQAALAPARAAAAAEASDAVLGTWVGVHACANAEDKHIALRITRRGALVHFHSGPASVPLSPGCFSARWAYNPDRTYLEIFPQAWLWRVGQANTLKISGWVTGTVFVAEVADVAGCRSLTLHRQEAGDGFPAECN